MLFMLEWPSGLEGGVQAHNKSLQVTFDPPPTFAAAKAGVASNAPELRRYAEAKSPLMLSISSRD